MTDGSDLSNLMILIGLLITVLSFSYLSRDAQKRLDALESWKHEIDAKLAGPRTSDD